VDVVAALEIDPALQPPAVLALSVRVMQGAVVKLVLALVLVAEAVALVLLVQTA
jgi:hypothetical protein